MLPELQGCEEAEDFFEALSVPFDPKALDGRRVVVLRRFGELLVDAIDRHPGAGNDDLRAIARAALQEALAAARGGADARPPPGRSCAACATARCPRAPGKP